MRRFIPRLYNLISFLLAMLILFPWIRLSMFMNYLASNNDSSFLKNLGIFFERYTGYRLIGIPLLMVFLSFLFLIASSIDRHKSTNKVTARPIENMSFAPLIHLGCASCLSGIMYYSFSLFTDKNTGFIINSNDYFGLGSLFSGVEFLSDGSIGDYAGLIIFAILLLLQIVFAIIFRRTYRKNFFIKFLTWLVFLMFAFVSIKGLFINYTGYGTFAELIKSCLPESVYIYKASEIDIFMDAELYAFYALEAFALTMYIIIASVRAHKNNLKFFKKDKVQEEKKDFKDYKSPFEQTERIDDPIYTSARTEQVIETQVEEKVVVRDVDFEPSNLDQIYSTKFDFKNVTMVKEGVMTDYYVNRVKFLTLSNYNKTMSFRLELDKAIRLIIQYPLIGKDKYENHKIWFKIEDASVLPQDVIVSIVKDAYNAALNNL